MRMIQTPVTRQIVYSGTNVVGDTPVNIKIKYESNPNTNAFTDAEKEKLFGIEAGATKETPATIKQKYESNDDTNAFTDSDKAKLDNMVGSPFRGEFLSLEELTAGVTDPRVGDYAYVDQGVGSDVVKYLWDSSDQKWVLQTGSSTAETPQSVKEKYESNTNTNAFTDSEKEKLSELVIQDVSVINPEYVDSMNAVPTTTDFVQSLITYKTEPPFGTFVFGNVNSASDVPGQKVVMGGTTYPNSAFTILLSKDTDDNLYIFKNDLNKWEHVGAVGKVDEVPTGEIFNTYSTSSKNVASAGYSHAEGYNTKASASSAHAEGSYTVASGEQSHAEGNRSSAQGTNSHAEGSSTIATGNYSHAEGAGSNAVGDNSHAEGSNTVSEGDSGHAEGSNTKAIAEYSHAEGYNTVANGMSSHSEGFYTITNNQGEHACGKYNSSQVSGNDTTTNTQFSVGIGTSDTDRKNAFEIKQNGDIYINYNGEYRTIQNIFSNGSQYRVELDLSDKLDGVAQGFTLPTGTLFKSPALYYNGLRQTLNKHYTIEEDILRVDFAAPVAGEELLLEYFEQS